MRTNSILKTVIAAAAVISLAGCLGGGGSSGSTGGGNTGGGNTGGGTGGGGTGGGSTSSQAVFDAKSQNYVFMLPTTTPINGKANYEGEISMLTLANTADPTEALVGNLDIGVNFGSGVKNPVTATASNFSGNVNGQATTMTGTLTTSNAISGDTNTVDTVTNPVGTLTSLTATLRGDISDPTNALSGDARMILNGNFKEDGGVKLSGGHQTTIMPTGGGSSIATGGSLYADKK